MDSGLAALLGSVVGGIGTFGATWLNVHVNRKRPDPAEEATKQLLRELLDHPDHDWRHMHTLANVVGLDQSTVRRLLLQIGARGSTRDGNLWGLVSRHPLTDMRLDADTKATERELLEKWAKEEEQMKELRHSELATQVPPTHP